MNQHAIFEGYAADADKLVPRFEAQQTEAVLAPVLDLLPSRPGKALDVGAGTGRDAAWLAERGHHVLAMSLSASFDTQDKPSTARPPWNGSTIACRF